MLVWLLYTSDPGVFLDPEMAKTVEVTVMVERSIAVKSQQSQIQLMTNRKRKKILTIEKIENKKRNKETKTKRKDTSTAHDKSESILKGDDGWDLLHLVGQLDCGGGVERGDEGKLVGGEGSIPIGSTELVQCVAVHER